jgi:hypothetical protein
VSSANKHSVNVPSEKAWKQDGYGITFILEHRKAVFLEV